MTIESVSKLVPSQEPSVPVLDQIKKSQDNKKLVDWVKNVHREMKSARSRQEMVWNLNLAFYYGNQNVEITSVGNFGRLQTPKAPPYRVRLIVNRVKPVVRTEIARLTSQKPSASVVPASSEDADLAAAYAAEQVWESVSNYSDLDSEFLLTAFWQTVCGVGFIKTWWDGSVWDDATDNQGSVKYASVTPYHLFVPDLREVKLQNQPYILNVYTRTVAQLKQQYGDKVKDVNFVNDCVAANEIVTDAVLNLQSPGKSENDAVVVYELWAKPGAHELLPNGGMIQVANEHVLYMTDQGIPYKHGRYPFTKFEHIPTGTFYSDSPVTDIIPIQREYNRTRSQIIEAKNRMAKPQLMAPRGSVEAHKITSEPGQVIFYRPGMAPPQPLPLQPLPAYVQQELDRSLMDIEDISGQHQVSRGGVPPGVTAATAISYLQEKDDSILSTAYTSVEKGMEDIARQTLSLIKQFWDLERTIKVVGADGSFDVLMLSGANVQTDIRMEGGSALPTSKAAKQAFIMDNMKMGFIPPEEGLKLLEVGGVQQLNRKLQLDENQARRENIKMKMLDQAMLEQVTAQHQQQFEMLAAQNPEGMIDPVTGMPMEGPPPLPPVIPVNSWDNHAVHVEVHNAFRKTQEFEQLPDVLKAQFESHVNDHMAAISQSMMEASQFSAMTGMPSAPGQMPGGPGGPEQSGPPGEPPPDSGGIPNG